MALVGKSGTALSLLGGVKGASPKPWQVAGYAGEAGLLRDLTGIPQDSCLMLTSGRLDCQVCGSDRVALGKKLSLPDL